MAVTTGAIAAAVSAAGAVGGAVADNNNAKAARKQSAQQRQQSLDYINRKVAETQGMLFNQFQPIQQNNNAAMLAGLDVYRQAFPAQLQSMNQGNMNAQNTLLSGLGMGNNALMGRNFDLSMLQPQQASIDPSALQGLYNPQALNFAPITQV